MGRFTSVKIENDLNSHFPIRGIYDTLPKRQGLQVHNLSAAEITSVLNSWKSKDA